MSMILLDCWLQTPIGVPCLLYIDGRHNRQLQVLLDRGAYVALENDDHRRLAAAQSPSSWWRIIWYGWFIFHPTNDCAISWVFGGFFKRGVSLAPGEKTSSEKYDNQAGIDSWNNQDGKSATLTKP